MKSLRMILLLCFMLFSGVSGGQKLSKLDSLQNRLKNERSDTGRVVLNYRISYELQYSDPDAAEEYARRALDEAKKTGFKKGEGNSLIQFGNIALGKANLAEAEEYYKQALEILKKAGDLNGVAICLNNIGIIAHNKAEYRKALEYYNMALGMNRENNKKTGVATSLFCIGTVFENLGRYDSALVYYLEAQSISESIGDSKLAAVAKTSLGNIYFAMGNPGKAREYYNEAVILYGKTDNKLGLLKSYYSLGQVSEQNGLFDEALGYYTTALDLSYRLQSNSDIANLNQIIGALYELSGASDSAGVYYTRALDIYMKTENKENAAYILISLARLENSGDNYEAAKKYLSEAVEIADEVKSPSLLSGIYPEMAITFAGLNDYRNAFVLMKRYSEIKDSLMTAEKQKQILELQTKYETERKEHENMILKKDSQILKTTRNSLIIGALLLSIIIVVIFRSLSIKKHDNRILKEQKEEIQRQKDIVEIQKTSITDSIRYAKRIQSAMLPPDDILKGAFKSSFVLYLPRDIVSGDFYWARRIKENLNLICAADCTGHGVPGAFMSMLGMAVLNDIINASIDKISASEMKTGEILDEMRLRIKSSLRQTGKEGEARDGMDLSLCLIDTGTGLINYSGANNPVYYVSEGNLTEIKSTRNPIGVYVNETSFVTNAATLPGNSILYMFSDGYSDQIGADGRKFLSKNFKSLLAKISHLPPDEIREQLLETHLSWRKDEEQVDDILVVGIRI